MSHKKVQDTRQNCICRYKGGDGRWHCSCIMYHITRTDSPQWTPDTIEKSHQVGGMILPNENPMLLCRRCENYCDDFSVYLKLRTEMINKKGNKK